MKTIFLLDGNSLLYRAFFALPPMKTNSGQHTNAIYGLTTVILKIIKEYNPEYMSIAFDVKGPTFRHELYKDYKIERPPMPKELSSQWDLAKKVCQALGIAYLELEKYEADDVIATLSEMAVQNGFEVVVIASDKDLYQLIDDKIKILNPKKYEFYDENKIYEIYKIKPSQITDFIALVGDKVDGIPGIKGIGEVSASKLLSQFKDLDDLYRNIDKISNARLKKALIEGREYAILSKELATLKKNLPLNINIEDLRLNKPNKDLLNKLFDQLQFHSLKDRISNELMGQESIYETVRNARKLIDLVNSAINKNFISIYVHYLPSNKVLGLSFSLEDNLAYYIPICHSYIGVPEQLQLKEVLRIMEPIWLSENLTKVIYDFKSFYKILIKNGIALKGRIIDPMLIFYLMDSSKGDYSIENISKEFLSFSGKKLEAIHRHRGKYPNEEQISIEEFANYACSSSKVIHQAYPIFGNKLEKESHLKELYEKIELPLAYVLAEMEMNGVRIDLMRIKKLSNEVKIKLDELSSKIFALTGEKFNLNSPKQISRILFERMKLPTMKRTKMTKIYSTDADVLEDLSEDYEIAKLLIQYRQLYKLKTAYLEVLPKVINQHTGRIHSIFNQIGTSTGRLSSSNPNLQNIPIKGELGKKIREAFVSENGKILICADYSQIELRILAHFSGDENLITAFQNNLDIHTLTASEIFNVPISEVSIDLRNKAKAINFGIIYGISAFGLSEQTNIPPDLAQSYIDAYFKKYPKILKYMENVLTKVKTHNYVDTLFGRRRYFIIKNKSLSKLTSEERAAINMPIQGTAADIIKLAMIDLNRKLKENKYEAKIILQIHDELLIEAEKKQAPDIKEIVKRVMENIIQLKVPLVAKVGIGTNWYEASNK